MPVVEAGLSPVEVEPPRLKAGWVLVAGVVVVVPEPGGLKALPPRRVLDGAGDDVEVSLGLGARPENRLLPEVRFRPECVCEWRMFHLLGRCL